MMRATTTTTSDVETAQWILGRHFYSNVIEVLPPDRPWTARFDVAPAGPVTVGDLQFGTDVRISFGELGAYHVDVPLSGSLAWRQGRSEATVATPAVAGLFQPIGDTVLEHWRGDCRLLAVKIDRGVLENELAEMLDAPVASPVRLGPALDVSRGAGATWMRLLRLVAADAAMPAGLFRHPVVDRSLQQGIVTGLLLAADHQYRDRLARWSPALAAPRAVRTAVEAMRADPSRPFTISDLAGLTGISRRSLQLSFQRYLGVPPMTYLRYVRLAHAHQQLQQADPAAASVADIAIRCGFLHLGRFASAYRARYGVPPSRTLRG